MTRDGDRDQPECLCSRSDSRYLGVHVATAGGCQRLLTHYRLREIRNSIYRYRKIYIDYQSKFSYRFISSISIIYGNTNWNTVKNKYENPNMLLIWNLWDKDLFDIGIYHFIQTKKYFTVCFPMHAKPSVPTYRQLILPWPLTAARWL